MTTYYRVRQRVMRKIYTERYVLVKATSPDDARRKASRNEIIDSGQIIGEGEESNGYGIVSANQIEIDEAWGTRHIPS